MEGRLINEGSKPVVPPAWPKKPPTDARALTMSQMGPSNPFLAPPWYQVWSQKQPHFMNYGSAAGASSSHAPTAPNNYHVSQGPPTLAAVDSNGMISKISTYPLPSDDNNNNKNMNLMILNKGAGNTDTNDAGDAMTEPGHNSKLDPDLLDPKKLRRTMMNRLSAQRSRQRKILYINELQNRAKSLEAQVGILTPQVERQTREREMLQTEQSNIKERMGKLEKDMIIKNAVIQEKKAEALRFRQIYLVYQQQLMAMMQQAVVSENGSSSNQQMVNLNPVLINPSALRQSMFLNRQQNNEMDMLTELGMKQQKENPAAALMDDWEALETSLSLNQYSGTVQVPASDMMESENSSRSSSLGGIEHILKPQPQELKP